ncbi:MAG: hypothetical protein L0H79_04965 [Intrasporangium sp.]|uniref:hypothetical protein n=1 Tax=Intrasporangium sp. TaxID=1925024 RepID=UPI00264A2883|nr:hypothetical protein [Intrasporangium sp.]MDN5795086.1 hypothetical protein [Intrasporangium sp.]
MSEEHSVNASALLAEAMSKSGLFWVEAPDGRTWGVWHVWSDGTAYVVSGPGEQPLPWLPTEARIILRSKDTGGRLLTTRATTSIVEPGTPEWTAAAELLKGSRLNAADDSVTRWAQQCTITALRPFGEPVEGPGSYDASAHRAEPVDTPATTASWRPWHWRGRHRRGTRRGR